MHCPHCYQRQAFGDSMWPCFTFCPFFQGFTSVVQQRHLSSLYFRSWFELGGGFVPAEPFTLWNLVVGVPWPVAMVELKPLQRAEASAVVSWRRELVSRWSWVSLRVIGRRWAQAVCWWYMRAYDGAIWCCHAFERWPNSWRAWRPTALRIFLGCSWQGWGDLSAASFAPGPSGRVHDPWPETDLQTAPSWPTWIISLILAY